MGMIWRFPRRCAVGVLTGVLALTPLFPGACRARPPSFTDVPLRDLAEVCPAPVRVHVVQKGETLTRIARKHGVEIASIVGRNPGLDPDRLQVGQKIILPPEAGR